MRRVRLRRPGPLVERVHPQQSHQAAHPLARDRAGGWFRVELEYFHRDSAYDQTSPILGASGEMRERLSSEVARASEHVYSLTSHNLFGNIYVDFDTGSRFTPYLGFGAGAGFTDLDNGRVLARRLDPAAITSVPDHVPNAEEVRRNLAGTTTTVAAGARSYFRCVLFSFAGRHRSSGLKDCRG